MHIHSCVAFSAAVIVCIKFLVHVDRPPTPPPPCGLTWFFQELFQLGCSHGLWMLPNAIRNYECFCFRLFSFDWIVRINYGTYEI